jgi:hypothetical protein
LSGVKSRVVGKIRFSRLVPLFVGRKLGQASRVGPMRLDVHFSRRTADVTGNRARSQIAQSTKCSIRLSNRVFLLFFLSLTRELVAIVLTKTCFTVAAIM